MTGRLALWAFVAASAIVHTWADMPTLSAWGKAGVALGMLVALAAMMPARYRGRLLIVLVAIALGPATTIWRVELRLADALHPDNINKVSRVVLRVASLPRLSPDSRQFEAEVLSSQPDGVPSRIVVSWSAAQWGGPYARPDRPPADFPDIVPGQVWRMALTLRPPHAQRNPQGFDYERHLFAQGIRATGSVRGSPKLLDDHPWASLSIIAQRARHIVREAMHDYVRDKRYGGVLLALAIGDQASVVQSDWEVFNRSGLTHLVSISGSHITMIAALGGVAVYTAWRRLRWRGRSLAERWPAQLAAAVVALAIAWAYSLLAGWGVPARRTFFMLAVVAGAYVMRWPLSASRLLALVAAIVVALDPWSVLSSGFWLSFGAVTVLMASATWLGMQAQGGMRTAWQRRTVALSVAVRLQLAITFALFPILALIFNEVSLASPLANAYAIPVISFIVTPASLLLAGAALVPGLGWLADWMAWIAHAPLQLIMVPTVWLTEWRLASFNVAAAPWYWTALAVAGVILALMPYGWPLRRWAWALMLPALCFSPSRPREGEWQLDALDVGQGSAIVLRTRHHTILFDTGLRRSAANDEGARSIVPFLRAIGVDRLGALVISHPDIDHAGGARSVLQELHVEQSYSSFDLHDYLRREARLLAMEEANALPSMPLTASACQYGMHWHVDEVSFAFLWPLQATTARRKSGSKARNAAGCVLWVQGRYHSALLMGDVGAAQEATIVERGLPPVDLVMAGHHGSKSSSSPAFVAAVDAQHVVAQVGAWNRYGHPHPTVQARWENSDARFWRSDHDGAVSFHSTPAGLIAQSTRGSARRYWQTEP